MKEPKPLALGKGALYINTYKTESNQPILTGTINIFGYTEKIAAWEFKDEEQKIFIGVFCNQSKLWIRLDKDEKRQNEKAPLFRGKFVSNEEKYSVAGWDSKTQSGDKCISIKVEKEKEKEYQTNGWTRIEGESSLIEFSSSNSQNLYQSEPSSVDNQNDNSEEDGLPF